MCPAIWRNFGHDCQPLSTSETPGTPSSIAWTARMVSPPPSVRPEESHSSRVVFNVRARVSAAAQLASELRGNTGNWTRRE